MLLNGTRAPGFRATSITPFVSREQILITHMDTWITLLAITPPNNSQTADPATLQSKPQKGPLRNQERLDQNINDPPPVVVLFELKRNPSQLESKVVFIMSFATKAGTAMTLLIYCDITITCTWMIVIAIAWTCHCPECCRVCTAAGRI
mmetsp:Transcript_32546/g.79195  ORF Transcript_32546/g.79195 Transcript_32546/m.79195 type:complete len:149 (+) Transcript_32546:4019-4465(+)